MQNFVNTSLLVFGATTYLLAYFYRESITPLTDVFEREFNATSSQVGFMSASFWLSYFICQIPCGIIVQYLTPEFILLICLILFTILTCLFGLPFYEANIMIPTIIYTISGLALSPIMLAIFAMIKLRLGNTYVPSVGGAIFFASSLFLFFGNLFQAFLYEKYNIWRPLYWVLSLVLFLILILFCITTFIESRFPVKPDYSEQELDSFDDTQALLNKHRTRIGGYNFLCGIIIHRKYNGKLKQRIFRSLKFAVLNPWNWLLGMHYFAALGMKFAFNGLWAISYMSLKFGYSRELSATISGTCFIADAVTNLISGKLAAKYKKRKIFFVICGVILFAPNYIIYCNDNANMYVIILMNFLIGVGTGISALPFALIREYNDCYECSDIAGGLFNTLCSSSAFVLQWLVGILMDIHWENRDGETKQDSNERIYEVQDYNHGLIVIPACSVLYFVIGLIIKETNAESIQWDHKKSWFARYFC